jgi:hypothetical protein
MNEPKLPGMPGKTNEQLQRRAHITAPVVELHRAVSPLPEVLDSKASITMKFKAAGDDVSVSIKPGPPNDEERNT